MKDELFNTVKYTGDTIKRTHGGRVYHLDSVAYTSAPPSIYPTGWSWGPWIPLDHEGPKTTLKAEHPKPEYWITDGRPSLGDKKNWLFGKIGEEQYYRVLLVWLIWKWQPGILPPLSRGARLKRSVRKAWRQGPSTSVRGMRK